jgi:hypothetical protein
MLELFDKRHDWLKSAFAEFRKTLPDAVQSFLETDSKHGKALVWGETQQGKTTLIMSLLGIRKEAQTELSVVLRGGAIAGQAATPVPMFYERSSSELWRVSSGDQELLSCESEVEVTKKIHRLRQRMKDELGSYREPMRIEIPLRYFDIESDTAITGILDVPGMKPLGAKQFELQAIKDAASLIRVFPVVFIVSKAVSCSTMFTTKSGVPGIAEWWTLPEKFKLVLTEAFTPKSFRGEDPDAMSQNYAREINRHLRHPSRTFTKPMHVMSPQDVFTVDIGDTQAKFERRLASQEVWAGEVLKASQHNLRRMVSIVHQNQGLEHQVRILSASGRIVQNQIDIEIAQVKENILRETLHRKKFMQIKCGLQGYLQSANAEMQGLEQLKTDLEKLLGKARKLAMRPVSLEFLHGLDGSVRIDKLDAHGKYFYSVAEIMIAKCAQMFSRTLSQSPRLDIELHTLIESVRKHRSALTMRLNQDRIAIDEEYGTYKLRKRRDEYANYIELMMIGARSEILLHLHELEVEMDRNLLAPYFSEIGDRIAMLSELLKGYQCQADECQTQIDKLKERLGQLEVDRVKATDDNGALVDAVNGHAHAALTECLTRYSSKHHDSPLDDSWWEALSTITEWRKVAAYVS